MIVKYLRFFIVICLLFGCLLFGCKREKPAAPKPPIAGGGKEAVSNVSGPSQAVSAGAYKIEMFPKDIDRNLTLKLVAKGFGLSGAEVEWLVNDRVISNPGVDKLKLNETDIRKGDKIQVKAVVKGQEVLSDIIEVKNALPEIVRVNIMPEVFKPGDTLSVEVTGKDADDDEVTFLYGWTKNGEPAGNQGKLDSQVRRGDKIAVKITPFDGTDHGKYGMVRREIRNMPPMMKENNKYEFDGNVYTYQIKAEDLDGDTLSYSLKSGPEGMSVDSAAGVLKWKVPVDFKGKATFTVSVSDGQGGEALQAFNINITDWELPKK